MNERAVEDAVMVALALECTIPGHSYFHRKNYYYPDMPKNFQISQYDRSGAVPVAANGSVSIEAEGKARLISVTKIQIEEDPGKLVHLGSIDTSPYTFVDYNRAGVALLEIITAPILVSPKEARVFLQKIRSILEHLGVSDGRLEGAMRSDANISIEGGKRVEVKNISSFKEVERALSFEISRQRSLSARGQRVVMETRHWDEVRRVTVSLRTKEEEHDYRYFPEGDLVPFSLSAVFVDAIKNRMPELPDARRERLVRDYGIPLYDAVVLTGDKGLVDFFEECVKLSHRPKDVSNWVMTDLQRWLHEQAVELGDARITPGSLVRLLQLIEKGTISGKIAKTVLREMVRTGREPEDIVSEQKLVRISSEEEIGSLVEKVFSENPKAVQDARTDEKATNYLVGKLMQATRGKADPNLANRVIREKLKETRPEQ